VLRDALPAAHEVARIMAAVPGMTIDRQPRRRRFRVVGFGRVDFSGVGLFRSTWINPDPLSSRELQPDGQHARTTGFPRRSLDKIAYAGDSPAESPDPVCIDNYVKDDPSADSV
jgi:hypothetical protein